ncbi:hypothetical protein GJAV_G00017480 [Gymnothorax javanicus]|nr:hypothetical protein GJAV_G00017480 [Gymnothorax javanicus]
MASRRNCVSEGKPRSQTEDHGWKGRLRRPRKDCLSESDRDLVRNFFCSSEISREFPDKKKVLRTKNEDGTEVIIPKRSMTSTTKEAHEVLKQLHPEIQLGLTLFKKLKPKEIVHVSETSLRSCPCQDCANASLKLQAIKKFALTTTSLKNLDVRKDKLISTSLCDYEGDFADLSCYERQCDNCSASQVKDYFRSLTDEHGDIDITWHKWTYVEVDRDGAKKRIVSCVARNTSLSLLVDELVTDLQPLPIHLFRATWQHRQIGMSIARLQNRPNGACIMMDFAENYFCRQKNEVQSAYFDQTQVVLEMVLHPMMAYYYSTNRLVKHTIVGVTDYRKDAHLVERFLEAALRIIKAEAPENSTQFRRRQGSSTSSEPDNSAATVEKIPAEISLTSNPGVPLQSRAPILTLRPHQLPQNPQSASTDLDLRDGYVLVELRGKRNTKTFPAEIIDVH